MNGKWVGGALIVSGLAAGAFMYYQQVYAYYEPVAFTPGAEILLTPVAGGQPEPILVNDITGTDGESSPIRFRACFTTPTSLATLTETYVVYEKPEPLIAPPWFDCFDAAEIGAALEQGRAVAFLSVADIRPGVDRVVAVMEDGRAFAWQQLNGEAE